MRSCSRNMYIVYVRVGSYYTREMYLFVAFSRTVHHSSVLMSMSMSVSVLKLLFLQIRGKRNANANASVSVSANEADCEDSTVSGVRSIVIERSEYGFGFTLRHFIVYPPESSAILARDRHLGFRRPTMPNEPIDTIFVKNVRENGPAHMAGLATGDRIVSVNGQDIGGLSYLRVVNLIFRTKGCLRLAVLPQQNDALQLYFGEAAHHPESNQKPRAHLADVASGYDHCATSMISSNTRHYSRNDSNSLYQQPVATTATSSTSRFDDVPCERQNVATWACSPPPPPQQQQQPPPKSTALTLRPTPSYSSVSQTAASDASSCCSCESVNGVYPPPPPPPSQMLPAVSTATSPAFNLNCTYSVDVEFDRNNYDSMSDSSLKDYLTCDDSVVMNRLRKSLEQKQEFLNRLPCSTSAAAAAASETTPIASRPSIGDANASPPPSSPPPPPLSLSPSSGAGVAAAAVTPPFQIVSIRAKQFEKGAAVSDKTELFRSELARLSVKKNAVTVATRKRDLENRVQLDKQAASSRAPNTATAAAAGSGAAKESRVVDNDRVAAQIRGTSSGNQTIPVGSNKLHCEPPSEFRSFCPAAKIEDDEKATRRISYLKATTAYSMNVDSENDLDDNEPVAPVVPQRRVTRKWRRAPLFPGDIQRLRRFFEDLATTGGERGVLGSRKIAEAFPPDQEESPVIKEGSVFCKVIHVEGKKASDRSWKPIWLILKGCGLYLLKEKKESLLTETPATFDKSDLGASCDRLDLRCSVVEVANDYTKRKHVFRLNAPSVGTELLLQAQDANCMSEWVRVLKEQAVVPVTSIEPVSTNFGTSVSPSACNKTLRKLASLRTRSPSADVPSNKAKKPALNDYQQTSPKTKTWKNKMAKQFRKIQPGGNSPVSSAAISYPPGATIGIPLQVCPSSTFSEHVPLIVQVCTSIVEAKGLEIIGIYRVPGNTAAVTSLTEAVNRGLEMTALDQDPRWSDVNVISSLLKSFFRKLPDALLTSELYPSFIKSDAIEDPIQRMITIRKLVHDLPDHNFETLKYLLFHLKKVVANSTVNKMEARNLAIVFGPTLIRSGDDMFTMVTDMSHQCRIVESLLSHVDWCFGDGDIDDLKTNVPETNSMPELEASSANHTLLLGNIRKVEECLQSPTTAKDFVSTIIGAANRKMHKTSKHLTGGGSGGGGGGSSRKSAAAAAAAAAAAYTGYAISSGSEDALDSVVAVPSIPVVPKNAAKRQNVAGQSKTDHVNVVVENDNRALALVTIPSAQVAAAGQAGKSISTSTSTSTSTATCTNDDDQVSWTYPKLSAQTKERIRKFEEETEALLQRCTNPRRLSGCISDEMDHKEKMSSSSTNRDFVLFQANDRVVHDSPPPVVVTRRNLPSVAAAAAAAAAVNNDTSNRKKSARLPNEFVRNNSMEKSTSLESLNRTTRPSSRHSDESCDLLMTLTSTFDKKLKSLSNDSSLCENPGQADANSRSECVNRVQVDRNMSFRDPSLHRNVEKSCKIDSIQKIQQTNITDKENGQHDEEKEKKEVDEKESVSVSVSHSEAAMAIAIQQNCDNWKRSVLQEMQSQQNRLPLPNAAVKRGERESKLFYSNSVKLRRSESLKEEDGAAAIKLRRSGSLNTRKYESGTKMSKFESLMLIRNAEAIKLRRVDSLTKSEKTETNLKRRQHTQMENSRKIRGGVGSGSSSAADKEGKMKRRNGANKCRNIKRRHTVGGTKDFDKVSWLHGQNERSAAAAADASQMDKENRRERRTSSPDLSSTKAAAAALASAPEFLVQVVVRPTSFVTTTADPNFVSRLLKIPLESHV
ncbi:rho GTPase-activating protein 21 isoform X2 [Planococcus citri]|uniref:rho GTPase-activating protein 21 isoform X2 n=1 Tax=Planococcus citri TaxID=170843 RepID=UPI0031F80973